MKTMNYLSISLISLLSLFTNCDEKVTILDSQQRLQRRLDDFAEGKANLAISAAIIKDDQLYTAVSGQSYDNTTFDDQRLFLAGSTTKMFVAPLVIKWSDEHEIALDAKVNNFLSLDDRFSGDITVRHLLNHTSGLADYVNDEYLGTILENPTHIFTPNELMTFVPDSDLQPGQEFQYANTNYLLLGMLLEEWSGKKLAELLREEILNPINTTNTSFFPFEALSGNLEHLWSDIDEDGEVDNLTEMGFTPEALLSGAWASGGLVSTPTDMVYLLKGILSGSILNDSQVESMKAFNEIIPAQYAYGMGLQKVNYGGEEWIGHDGSLLHYTMLFYHPSTDSYVAIMANQDEYDYDNLMIEIADIFQ
jgi:D-alanyl-D-alanine carboxypeptidase